MYDADDSSTQIRKVNPTLFPGSRMAVWDFVLNEFVPLA
jgi:hypothetical protein